MKKYPTTNDPKTKLMYLRRAYKRLKGHWTKNKLADNGPVDECPVCLVGAINWAFSGNPYDVTPPGLSATQRRDLENIMYDVTRELVECMPALQGGYRQPITLPGFNDDSRVTEKDVLKVISCAIKREKEKIAK